jgi:hypothetical protein
MLSILVVGSSPSWSRRNPGTPNHDGQVRATNPCFVTIAG